MSNYSDYFLSPNASDLVLKTFEEEHLLLSMQVQSREKNRGIDPQAIIDYAKAYRKALQENKNLPSTEATEIAASQNAYFASYIKKGYAIVPFMTNWRHELDHLYTQEDPISAEEKRTFLTIPFAGFIFNPKAVTHLISISRDKGTFCTKKVGELYIKKNNQYDFNPTNTGRNYNPQIIIQPKAYFDTLTKGDFDPSKIIYHSEVIIVPPFNQTLSKEENLKHSLWGILLHLPKIEAYAYDVEKYFYERYLAWYDLDQKNGINQEEFENLHQNDNFDTKSVFPFQRFGNKLNILLETAEDLLSNNDFPIYGYDSFKGKMHPINKKPFLEAMLAGVKKVLIEKNDQEALQRWEASVKKQEDIKQEDINTLPTKPQITSNLEIKSILDLPRPYEETIVKIMGF